MIEFHFKSELDPVSVAALVVSLFSFAIAFLSHWRNGFRIRITASGGFITIPDDGYGEKICVILQNIGGKKVKINSITFSAGDARKSRGLMPTHSFPIETPFHLEVGDQQSVYFHQERLIELTGRPFLQCNVWVPYSANPITTRVKFRTSDR